MVTSGSGFQLYWIFGFPSLHYGAATAMLIAVLLEFNSLRLQIALWIIVNFYDKKTTSICKFIFLIPCPGRIASLFTQISPLREFSKILAAIFPNQKNRTKPSRFKITRILRELKVSVRV